MPKLSTLLVLAIVVPGVAFAEDSQRPNFVFFLVDDLGWGAMGAYGNEFHETPHFDELCERGMRFTHAYSACTVCSPSRAAILTGQYPGRTNLTDWIPGHGRANAKLNIPDWHRQMDHRHTTLAEALQQDGYRTAFVGKWHLVPIEKQGPGAVSSEDQKRHYPEHHGFDVNIGGREWGQPKGRGKYFYPFDMPGLNEGESGEYLTDRLTDEAIAYLDQQSDKPFLLYMSYYTVHGPVMGKKPDVEYFQGKRRENPSTASKEKNAAAYAAMHRSLDLSVGRVLAKIEAMGEKENTVVIFTGDNGGDYNSACGGLRGFKGHAFEGGTREPTCVVWPGVTEPGAVSTTPIIGMDFYPTMLEIANLQSRPEQHVDGKSLVPLLEQSGALDRETLYWHYPHYHRTLPYGAIRHHNWKLIEYFEDGKLMLFNLETDPSESQDVASTDPDKAKELLSMLEAWREQVGAQMPTPNPDYSN
ncbi:MAG: sulfatase [Aeoliella sp.]